MEALFAMLLGAIQGATEFLPVSSSGHLAAAQMMLLGEGLASSLADQPLVFEILLHVATLMAVLVFYRREVWEGLSGALRAALALVRGRLGRQLQMDDGANLGLAVLAGTVPTGVIGLLLRGPAGTISRSPVNLGLTFMGCACLLLATRWWSGGARRLSIRYALVIGAIQGVAVLPGISRSGATIAAALALGLHREEAVRFSFLLSLPAILGAAVLEIEPAELAAVGHLKAYLLGGLMAFVVGLGCLALLVRLVRGGRMWMFAPYVAAAGLFTMLAIG